jgi:hypothetical protein
MKEYQFYSAIFALSLSILGSDASAASLSIDLDSTTQGIQTNRTLTPGNEYEFSVVFTGDGVTQFDTFAMDVVYSSANQTSSINLHNPVAGMVADSAPLFALDIYNASIVNSGGSLSQGNIPVPLGYDGSLGSVGLSSVGGMPFPLIGEDETVELFSGSITAMQGGMVNMVLSGFPFGVGAELSLGGESVSVELAGADVTVVPVPAAAWLFMTGLVTLFGIRGGKREDDQNLLGQIT